MEGGLDPALDDYYNIVHELLPQTAPQHITRLLERIGVEPTLVRYLIEKLVSPGGGSIQHNYSNATFGYTADTPPVRNIPAKQNNGPTPSSSKGYLNGTAIVDICKGKYEMDYRLFHNRTG